MRDFFFFFVPFSRGGGLFLEGEIARVWRVLSLRALFSHEKRERERSSFSFESASSSSFRAFSFSLFLVQNARVPSSSSSSSRRSFFSGHAIEKSAADSASHHRANFLKNNLSLTETFEHKPSLSLSKQPRTSPNV